MGKEKDGTHGVCILTVKVNTKSYLGFPGFRAGDWVLIPLHIFFLYQLRTLSLVNYWEMKFCLAYPLVTFPHSQPLVWDVGGPETVLCRWEIGTRAVLIFDLLLQNPSSGEWIQGACARMGLDTRQEYHIIRGEVSMGKCQLLRHLRGSPTLSGPQFVEDTAATVPERMLLKITLASLQHLKFQSPS